MAEASVFSLYPRPPEAPANILSGDPSKVIGLMNALNQNILGQQSIRANKGIEELYKGDAIRPDGTVDNALVMGRAPATGIKGPEIVSTLQQQEGQRILNATNMFGQLVSQNKFLTDRLGTLADDPNLSKRKVMDFAVTAARTVGIPGAMINEVINKFPNDPAGLRAALVTMSGMARGSGDLAPLVEGQPGEGGERRVIPSGAAAYETRGVKPVDPNAPLTAKPVKTESYRPGMPVTQPVGEPELQKASADQYANLRKLAETSPQVNADLANLRQFSKIMDDFGGPTADLELKANTLAQRVGIKDGVTLGRDKVAAAQEFNKIANQLASNQQRQMSDAGLRVSEGSNPSIMMSQLGRDNVVAMLQGNQDAITRWRREASKAGIQGGQYHKWAEENGSNFDVRAFQFARLPKAEQQKFINTMETDAAAAMLNKYEEYRKKDWVR